MRITRQRLLFLLKRTAALLVNSMLMANTKVTTLANVSSKNTNVKSVLNILAIVFFVIFLAD